MSKHPLFKAYLALVSVCFFWGTTYLTIRMALETFPPLALVSIRFVCSGTLMLIGAKLAGAHLPRGRELRMACITGLIILGISNGCLTFAEQWVPSGLAALIVTVAPFWMIGIEALMPGGEKLHLPAIAGMLLGSIGVAMLVAPEIRSQSWGSGFAIGFLILQFSSAAWAFGSIYSRRQPGKAHPIVIGAVQQLAAGLAYVIPALLIRQHPILWKARGVSAIVYLILFGSIVGYSSYVYALNNLPVAVTSIYSYVNPIVAVFLGWLIYREHFGWMETVAMIVILTGVAIVKRFSPRHGAPAHPSPEPEPQALRRAR